MTSTRDSAFLRLALAVLAAFGLWQCSGTIAKSPADAPVAGRDAPVTDRDAAGGGDAARADAGPRDSGPDPCLGVTCSGHGACARGDGGLPVCVCDASYHPAAPPALDCVADETCQGVTCGRCAQCQVVAGVASCTCPSGFRPLGDGCTPDPDPCTPNPCQTDEVCLTEIHCVPSGACVPSCDCTNCGNCGPGQFSWTANCGSPDGGPPTVRCTKPCPSPGDGCIPAYPGLCYPGEGCFSAP